MYVCHTGLARHADVLSVGFPFPRGQEDYALASKQETRRDQPQKQETEERDQTTVLAGLTCRGRFWPQREHRR